VVLAYQSAEGIAGFVEKLAVSLDGYEPEWEIVLVGNYFENQGDRTPEVVQEIADGHERIVAVTRIKEGMMGWDMKTGLETARGETLAVIDGDGQMPFEDVVAVYKKIREEQCDLVKTYRIERDDGTYRKFISKAYNFIFKLLFPGLHSRDINSKPKIITRNAYERMDLKSDGWFIDAEIMIQARRLGLTVREIPTTFRCLEHRSSFIKPQAILEFFANLLWSRVVECLWWLKKTKR